MPRPGSAPGPSSEINSKQPLQSVLVLLPNMRSVQNGHNHVPETSTPDTGSANELHLFVTCFGCAHSWCICTHAKAPRTPITPLIKLKNAARPARTSAPPHNTHDRTETLKKQKERNPAHPATSGRSGSPAQKTRLGPAQKRPALANRTQIESCRSLTRTQSPRLIKQILRIQNKISYAYELLRDGWAQRTISRALQECHYFVPRHVSRKALNYMHTEYLKIDF